MIDARELRIGNFVKLEGIALGEKFEVKSIEAMEVMVENRIGRFKDQRPENLEPIPLTEEWLVKFGFDFYKDNNSWQLDTELGFSIWGRIETGLTIQTDSDEQIGNEMLFIHQLQNLYFALTGTELTLSPQTTTKN